MKNDHARDFARAEMLEESETLKRAEAVGPFVVALVELAECGYENRVAQPAVIRRNRRTRLPLVNTVETYGPSRYRAAARRFGITTVQWTLLLFRPRSPPQRSLARSRRG